MHRLDKGLTLLLVGGVGMLYAWLFTPSPRHVAAAGPDFSGALSVDGLVSLGALMSLVTGVYLIATTPKAK